MTSVAAVASPLANKRPSLESNWDSKNKPLSTSSPSLVVSSSPGGARANLSPCEPDLDVFDISKSPVAGDAEMRKLRIELLLNSPKSEQYEIAALDDVSCTRSSESERKSIHENGATVPSDFTRIVRLHGLGSGSVGEGSDSVEIELDDISSSCESDEEASTLDVKEKHEQGQQQEENTDEKSPQTPLQECVNFSPVPQEKPIDDNFIASPTKSTREEQGCQEAPFTPPQDICDNVKKSASGLYYPPSPSRSSRRGKSSIASPVNRTRKEPDYRDAPYTPSQVNEYDYVDAAPDIHFPSSPGRSSRRGVIVPGQHTVEDIIETIANSSISCMPTSTQLQCFVKDKKSIEEEKQQQQQQQHQKKKTQRKKLKQFPPPRPKTVKKGRMLGMTPNMEADGLIRDPSFVSKPPTPASSSSNNNGGSGRSLFSWFRSQ